MRNGAWLDAQLFEPLREHVPGLITEGSILGVGVDIRDVSQHDLRDKIGDVPQTSGVLCGTFASDSRT